MSHRMRVWIAALGGVGAALATGSPALAQPLSDAVAGPAPGAPAATVLFNAQPLDSAALDAWRGGAQVVNNMRLKGVVADNEAINVNTGNNVISSGSFSGASGVPVVIQNSGNNVLIQNATIVNLQVR